MKRIKDCFCYHDKWGIGGSCIDCIYASISSCDKECWPISNLCCKLHDISLNGIIKDGYLYKETFCKNMKYTDVWSKFEICFLEIKDQLEENVLYEACQEEYLCMIPFSKLPKDDCSNSSNNKYTNKRFQIKGN